MNVILLTIDVCALLDERMAEPILELDLTSQTASLSALCILLRSLYPQSH